MSITLPYIPQSEPQRFAAGDTVQWRRTLNDYPSPTFTLHYVLRSPAKIYKFDAAADSGGFLVTLATTTTKDWVAGQYFISAYVTNAAGDQKQVSTAFVTVEITANLASNPQGGDPRSWAARTLASIEETVAALTTRQVASASVNGQSYSLANLNELFLLRERLKSEVLREQSLARLNAGLGAGNKIGIRFRPLLTGGPFGPRVPWQ